MLILNAILGDPGDISLLSRQKILLGLLFILLRQTGTGLLLIRATMRAVFKHTPWKGRCV